MRSIIRHAAVISISAAAALMSAGCTSNATRLAISNHEFTESRKQDLFDNALRIADEQMFLNLSQFALANQDKPEAILAAQKATWQARRVIEELRVQYAYSRWLTESTVGAYLYDSQGWMNVLLEDASKDLVRANSAVQAANKAVGVSGVGDLIKLPATK